jgi:hypothetical protein
MWEALEQAQWVRTFGNTAWMYITVSVIHYLSMFWFIGSAALIDLRIAGIAVRRRNVTELADQLFPWAWIGLALAIASGFLMFSSYAGDWAPDPVFQIKLALIVLGAVCTLIVQVGVPRWAQRAEIPVSAKAFALFSLLVWIATLLCASEIPGREGLG